MAIVAVSAGSAAYSQVLELHRQNRRWLGHLPFAAFERYANDGTLLAFTDGQTVLGYALYRLPANHVSLTHLCVAKDARGQGVAQALVDEIVRRHADRTGIRLRCRRDFPAAAMWPHLDFEPQGDVVGHSHAGDLLTQWWRDFGHPTLFNQEVAPERVQVALDTDVFLDLTSDREAGEASRLMFAASWVADVFELSITKQLTQEINNNPDPEVRRRNQALAEGLRRAGSSESEWRSRERLLLDAVKDRSLSDHDRSDIRHLARAAASGARYFVSRDQAQRKLLGDHAAQLLRVEILSPAELVQLAHQQAFADYEFRSIEATRFSIRPVIPSEIEPAVQRFVNASDGEPAAELRTRVQSVLAEPDTWHVDVVEADGGLVALMAYRDHRDHREVALLRLHQPSGITLARQLGFQLRDGARRAGLRGVVVSDHCLSREVQDGLAAESFVLDTTGWIAATVDLTATRSDIRQALGSVPRWFQPKRDWAALRSALANPMPPTMVAEIEQRLWPLKVTDGDLPTFLVPIAPSFAEDLFDPDLKAQTLFPRSDSLGISREHVYYRAPSPRRPAAAPARIVWYVKQHARRPNTGAVRACSLLLEVTVEHPDRLHRRFGRYGVWRRDDVRQAAHDGKAMALRFTNTELFTHPVTLADLRAGAAELGCPTPFLQSPWQMPRELFEWTYRKGRGDETAE